MEPESQAADIERLLEQGRNHFERGETETAVAVWSEVLQLRPDEPRALEYLRTAGHVDEHIPTGAIGPLRAQLEHLLAERKYEEALDFLHTARWATPDAPEISRGIHLLKERLLRRYLAKVGNLDAVPRVTAAAEVADLSDEERALLRLVDGISTFGDIAHESRLGRFETYRSLSRFVTDGIVVAEPVASDVSAATGVRATTAPPPRRRRGMLLATEIAVAVGVLGGGGYYLFTRATDGRHPAPPAAVSAPEPASAPPEPATPATPPIAVAPDAPAIAIAAAPDAHAAEIALLPDAHSEFVLEIHPEPAPPQRPEREPARPRPPPRREEKRAAASAHAPSPPPTTPTAPPPAPEPAPAPAPAPEPAPVAEKPAPSPSTEKPAPPPAPVPTSFDTSAATSEVAVVGPLARGVVERAVSRALPTFHSCYAPAARAAKRNAAGAVRVVLTIDETGRAQDVSASSEPVPGVAACVADAARQIRTQVPPDVGTARVAFTVTYTPRGH